MLHITHATIGAACAVTAALALTPAHANDADIVEALGATMKKTDVPSALGTTNDRTFSAQYGSDSIVVCFTDKLVLQKGVTRSYSSSFSRGNRINLTQYVYGYRSAGKARSAWKALNRKVDGCTGTVEQAGSTTTLRNGSTPPRYESGRGRWVATTTTDGDRFRLVDHMIFFRSGPFIQTLEYEVIGETTITDRQLTAIEALSAKLDRRWLSDGT